MTVAGKSANHQDFSTTFSVDRSPADVFAAVTNPRGWWSEEIEGGTSTLGDEFTYHYQEMHRCRVKLVEVVPEKRVVWLVLDNYFDFTEDKSEWKNTKVAFEIHKAGTTTELHFSHQGLVPEYECYDVCSNAWGKYINGSLRSLIMTGKGNPNQKEAGSDG
jgi:uncharacterized protein YndB with AHSA1/START domain